MKAKLRTCASCEWIFHSDKHDDCPKCGFAHYSARYVYGNACYRYAKTQKPWYDRKISDYGQKLCKEIKDSV